MDRRPIGVFDSGLGGLTAVKALSAVLPHEDIVYFGDTGRVPYGGHSKETIIKYARQDVSFLLERGIKAIVVACGTVSTNALDVLETECPVPILGVAVPAASSAAAVTKNKKVGLIGTVASIRSGAYERLIHNCGADIEVFGRGCPLLVPLVENGRIGRGDHILREIAEDYLAPIKDRGVDTLILGCTHFPIIKDVIGDIMGEGVTLVDPGAETALSTKLLLSENGLLTDKTERGSRLYCVSDEVDGFAKTASLFLEQDVIDDVCKIDIEKF